MQKEKKAFNGYNHGKGQIDLRHHGAMRRMLPVEIHLKEDGSIKDEPTFCIIMTAPLETTVLGEISLEMLNEGLDDIGYEIRKK